MLHIEEIETETFPIPFRVMLRAHISYCDFHNRRGVQSVILIIDYETNVLAGNGVNSNTNRRCYA